MDVTPELRRSPGLAVVVGLALVWTAIIWVAVVRLIDWGSIDYVGTSAASGVVGLLVLMGLGALLAGLLLTPRGTEPSPEAWPPR